jgi:arylformamidase
MYDLTQPLNAHTPTFPGDPAVEVAPCPGFAPWQVSRLSLGTHSGTHMDAPRHRLADGPGIGSFGPDRLVGRGMVIDARGHGENEALPVSVFDAVRGRTWPGWFALVRTGWDRQWGDAVYFRHPYLSSNLAEVLADSQAGIVAIDTLSVDSTVDSGEAAHLILLQTGILIAENLCCLDALETGRPYAFAFLPLSLGDADGSPARVVAWDPGALNL